MCYYCYYYLCAVSITCLCNVCQTTLNLLHVTCLKKYHSLNLKSNVTLFDTRQKICTHSVMLLITCVTCNVCYL